MLGIPEFSNRSPRTFSSGESKRAAIARALCRETELIILDEPFTHIDSSSAAILEEVIGNLSNDRTLIFSTHELARAYRLADRIITLQDGRIFPWTPENMFRMIAHKVEDGYELRTGSGASVYYPGELADERSCVVSLNPNEVFMSKEQIISSARNSYSGVITKIESSGNRTVHVSVECRKDFSIRAALTERSVRELGCNVGDTVWVHFKSTAIHVH
jgi:molybdopterin-binding protein